MTTKPAASWVDALMRAAPKPQATPAAVKPDWEHLVRLAMEADRPLTDEEQALWQRGLVDGNSRMWNVDYVHAAQEALEQRRPERLTAMLEAEVPVPTFLLPVIAAVIRARMPGKEPRFTLVEHNQIRELFDRMVEHWYPEDGARNARSKAIAHLVQLTGASKKTIERSLKLTEPKT